MSGLIGIQFNGRLGNQLFQYAAARCVAERLGCELVLLGPHPHGRVRRFKQPLQVEITRFFPEVVVSPRSFLINTIHSVSERIFQRMCSQWFPHRIEPSKVEIGHHEWSEVYDPAMLDIEPGTLINGYFQSECYLAGREADVRQWFRPSAATEARANRLLAPIAQTLTDFVAIHVRLGDYKMHTLRVHGEAYPYALGRSYYVDAVAQFPMGARLALFSDEPEFAATLPPRKPDWICPSAGPAETLRALAQFPRMVMANSSFSWWAAWLGGPVNTVIAPRYHIGRAPGVWYPEGIQVSSWTYI
jgi:hypothetical protein